MPSATNLSPFALAYIGAALWSSTDDDGEPLDANYSRDNINTQTLINMALEADAFAATNRELIQAAGLSDERAGHCFWLNRNGHGSGFWDEKVSIDPPEERAACEKLSAASKAAGSRDLYVESDTIYQQ